MWGRAPRPSGRSKAPQRIRRQHSKAYQLRRAASFAPDSGGFSSPLIAATVGAGVVVGAGVTPVRAEQSSAGVLV